MAVIHATGDVPPDDPAAVNARGETWLGRYRPAPGGYFTLDIDGRVSRFRPGAARLLGRVCHFERRGG